MPSAKTVFTGIAMLVTLVVASPTCWAQDGADAATEKAPQAESKEEAARREILESDEWDAMRRDFQKWLGIQQVYSADEVTHIVNQLNDRAVRLSADELRELLHEMQDRLQVLLSPQAAEARQWVSQYLSGPRASAARSRSDQPDVLSMSADEIRSELQGFQQRQVARQQSQAEFDRIRALQAEVAMEVQAARRQSQQQIADSRSRAAIQSQVRSPYAPRPQDLPNYTDFDAVSRQLNRRPYHTISPWGTPIRWHPLYGEWYDHWW